MHVPYANLCKWMPLESIMLTSFYIEIIVLPCAFIIYSFSDIFFHLLDAKSITDSLFRARQS